MKSRMGRAEEVQTGEVRLFSTKDTVVALDSPIKIRILELASAGPVPFDTIVEETGRAKSTISVHIRDLERAGLITSYADPHDSRRRLIELLSVAIGRLTNADRNAKVSPHVHKHGKSESFKDEEIVSFFRYVVRVFRSQAMAMGINIDPVLQRTGTEVGSVLAVKCSGRTVEDVICNMDIFWQTHGLGKIVPAGKDPLTIEVRDCFECEDLPLTGHGACAFDTGVLAAVFSHHFKYPVKVVEVECYSSGDDRCIFVITPRIDPA